MDGPSGAGFTTQHKSSVTFWPIWKKWNGQASTDEVPWLQIAQVWL
jgi:hypothetical protein